MILARTPQVRPCRLADRRPGDQLLARIILRCAPAKYGPVLAALIFGGMALAPAPAGAEAYVRMADGVVVTPTGGEAKRVRIEVVSAAILHVTAFPSDELRLPRSLMAVNTGRAGVAFTVSTESGAVTLSTEKLKAVVRVRDG